MNAQELRAQIAGYNAKLLRLKGQLKELVRECGERHHDWTDPIYDPIRTEAQDFPGDPEGTMGVDRQLPCRVPASIVPQWTRECSTCGHTEHTKSFVFVPNTNMRPVFNG